MMRAEPWNQTLRARMAMLRPGTHRVAYFAPKPDAASFRYRCYNTSSALNTFESDVSASYFFLSDLDHLPNLSDYADTLVVFRTPYDTDVDRVISSFSRAGKTVFFDIDDLVFDVRYAPLVTSNLNYKLWGKDIDQWFAFIANIGATLKLCDHVVTTNAFIADRVTDFSGLPVSVIPNSYNALQKERSDALRVTRTHSDGEGLKLGYFSGSHSHTKDFAIAVPGIAQFLRQSPHSTLTILGHLEVPEALGDVGQRIIRKPFMNFLDLQNATSEVDVALSPLQSGPFTSSKSELKFFESALVGTLTLASPTPVFTQSITHGENGFLAGASQWFDVLTSIEETRAVHKTLLTDRARQLAQSRFSPEAIAPQLRSLFVGRN